jgi:hypothetical protein
MQPYIDAVGAAGDVGLGKPGKWAKQDMIAGREGRIEDMGRLRPVLSAIRSNTASAYGTAQRDTAKNFAFSDDPALQTAMMTETGARLNEQAGNQFANAAAGAYGDAENTFESARRYRGDMGYRAATDQASLYRNSLYDASRKGGLLQDILRGGLAAGAAALGAPGGAGALLQKAGPPASMVQSYNRPPQLPAPAYG